MFEMTVEPGNYSFFQNLNSAKRNLSRQITPKNSFRLLDTLPRPSLHRLCVAPNVARDQLSPNRRPRCRKSQAPANRLGPLRIVRLERRSDERSGDRA